MSASIRQAVEALLDSESQTLIQSSRLMADEEDSPSLELRQGKLCEQVLQGLERLPHQKTSSSSKGGLSYASDSAEEDDEDESPTSTACFDSSSSSSLNSLRTPTVRSVLGDITDVSHLPHLLSMLMTYRVDTHQLLPLTYDAKANQEAISSHYAITLTRPALQAAQLYAQLVAMPGSLGSGLIEMQALSALAALVRRWRVECCGREQAAMDEAAPNHKKPSYKRHHGASKEEDDDSDQDATQPVKRSRQSRTRSIAMDSDSEASDDSYGDLVQEEVDGTQLEPRQLVLEGLKVARQVCQIPLQREFLSWSCEAREAVMDAVASVLATSAALLAGRSSSKHGQVSLLASSVVQDASKALVECILEPNASDETESDNDSDHLTKRHETAVSILRGLLPILTAKEALPKGESGKQAASVAAAQVLESFIQEVANDIQVNYHRWPRSMTTPGRRRASVEPTSRRESMSNGLVTPSLRRDKRRSLGGFDDSQQGSSASTPTDAVMTPAKLKTKTPGSAVTPVRSTGRPRPVLSAILGVLQKLATVKGLEKASTRNSTIETLHRCIGRLPLLERSHFLKFLIQMCHSKVSVHRLVSVEVVGRVLLEEWLWSEHERDVYSEEDATATPASRRKSLSPLVVKSSQDMPAALFGALQGRLLDRLPAIRAATASAMSDICGQLLEIDQGGPAKLSTLGLKEVIAEEASALVDSLRRRASSDDKATVRRAAVGALAGLLVVCESVENSHLGIAEGDISILSELCQDTSMLTRKASAEALTLLVERLVTIEGHSSVIQGMLEQAWCSSVLPLALDSENSCTTKAVELADRVLFVPILGAAKAGNNVSSQTAWNILASVGDGSGRQGASRSETEALRVVVGKRVAASADSSNSFLKDLLCAIRQAAVHTLDESIDVYAASISSQRAGAWSLFNATMDHSKDLSEITRVVKRSKIELDFLRQSWDKMLTMSLSSDLSTRSAPALRGSMRNCLHVQSKLASCTDASVAQETAINLQELLETYKLPPEIIGSAITALSATTIAADPSSDPKQDCARWIRGMFRTCEQEIASHVNAPISSERETSLVRAIFTVGELSLVGFSASDDDSPSAGVLEKDRNGAANIAPIRGLCERPSSKLVDLVQVFLAKILPGGENSPNPVPVRAHAFTTLGKLCLRDEKLAKRCLNILARELYENMSDGSSIVQSNSLLVLGDLCVRYTNMVDRYLPVMAACLQSGITDVSDTVLAEPSSQGAALVRKHSVLLLSSLLLQDYIKWRGLLFHRFLVASVDEDDGVAHLAEMVLCGPLVTKQPKLFFNQFVESLFVLNRCTAHPIYQAAAATGDAGSGVSVGFDGIALTGEVGRVKRLLMYNMMLSKMTDEEKIGVTARITKEVLGSALQGGSDLNRVCTSSSDATSETSVVTAEYESALNALSDAFAVLSSPAIRVGNKASREADDIEDVPNISKRVVVAKGHLLSNISRKHLIETILPILCGLKAVLQKSCSRLLKDLMGYLVEVFRLYKNEVKEFLANEPSLLQEIEYDARQFRKAQRGTPGKDNSFAVTQTEEE